MGAKHTSDNKLTEEIRLRQYENNFFIKECPLTQSHKIDRISWTRVKIILIQCKLKFLYSDVLSKTITVDKDFQIVEVNQDNTFLTATYNHEGIAYTCRVMCKSFTELQEFKDYLLRMKRPLWKTSPICQLCCVEFSITKRKHHCRHCGKVACSKCSPALGELEQLGYSERMRICIDCEKEIQRHSRSRAHSLRSDDYNSEDSIDKKPPTFRDRPHGLNFTFGAANEDS